MRIMNINQVAQELGCSQQHVRTLIDLGLLPSITIGKGHKVLEDDLLRMIETYKGCDISNAEKALAAKARKDKDRQS